MTDSEQLVEEVMCRGATRDRSSARLAIEAVLDAVALPLGAADRAAIARQLPGPFAAVVRRPSPDAAAEPEILYARVASAEGVGRGLAMEHAQAACAAMAAYLDSDARAILTHRLAPEWAALFSPAPRAMPTDRPRGTVAGHGHTLATGRPGSRRPLSEGAPAPAQTDSVIGASNPHGDRKLSSVEDDGEPDRLATSRSGAVHPIAGAKDERRPH